MGQRLKPSPRGEITGSRGGRSTTRRRADRDPATRRGAIVRPRLLTALDAGSDARLTLVTGPPGSGKTVLLATWLATRDPQTMLISLDPGDHTVPGSGASLPGAGGTSPACAAPAPTTPEALVERLWRSRPRAARIHADTDPRRPPSGRQPVHARDADGAAARRAAPRLVISSRVDPGLALQRLRLAGALTEIRGPDLAFTPERPRAMLAVDGIALSPPMLQQLWTRTEGWAAGLRLAALSLAGHADPDAFVADFAGDDRAVVAYLIEEVLERQSEQARELLLATAVVDQVSAPLANALTGGSDAVAILDDLLTPTPSWCRSTVAASGFATTRSSPISCARSSRAAGRWRSHASTGAPHIGSSSRTARWTRSTTR